MISFGQAKDMFKMQREAKRIKKELRNIHVEAEAQDVKVVVSAEQEVISIVSPRIPDDVAKQLIDALNRAQKKAQIVSAERMRGLMGDMGLPVSDQQ